MSSKICTVCGVDKPFSDFRKYGGRSRFGLRPLCKPCQRVYEASWRSKSSEYRKTQRDKRSEKTKEYSKRWRAEHRVRYLISAARRRAEKIGVSFDLDLHVEELKVRLNRGVCEVSGIPLDLTIGIGRRFNGPSLDRKTPKDGYVLSNVRIVAFAVNAMLGDWGEETAFYILDHWAKHKDASL